MKKMLLVVAVICSYFVSHAQMTNNAIVSMQFLGTDRAAVKAAREFQKKNGDGKDERWYKLAGGYLAEFTEGTIQCKSVFDYNGSWLYTIREYSEKELPKDVRTLVKSTYYDFTIGWVKEVAQFQSVVYVIHIDNAQEWKDLLVQDGEIAIQHEVVK